MKRCSAASLPHATLGLLLIALPLTAADYEAARPPAAAPIPATSANDLPALAGELELRIQYRLLSSLAQEHRQRSELAAKAGQSQRARWEADLAEELGQRGSNVLSRLEQIPAHEQAPPGGGSVEATKERDAAERAYLVKLQERLQAVQQTLAAASEESTFYALKAATNNTTWYGDSLTSERQRDLGREIRQLQSEQAALELKKLEFLALRSMLHPLQKTPRP